jgi:tRNA pseudouridine55 synthase
VSPAPDGLLVVDKPSGWTSHDVVARGRRLAATRQVGHAGTLDPMATGVLVLGVGRATRLLGHLALATKAYDATVRLGQSTITDDAEGDVTTAADASQVSDGDVERACAGLAGDIQQVPSAVSAIKIKGERAYKRARAGETVELAARPVTVSRLDVLAVRRSGDLVDVDIRVECSTGTYIRALARDIGADLGVGGHLTALRRTRVGPYEIEVAHTLDELGGLEPEQQPVVGLADAAAGNFATFVLPVGIEFHVRNGRPLQLDLPADGTVAMMTSAGEFLALYVQDGPIAKPLAVFPPPAEPAV